MKTGCKLLSHRFYIASELHADLRNCSAGFFREDYCSKSIYNSPVVIVDAVHPLSSVERTK